MTSFEQAAAGRVNLIGEHTDYNGGYVLPTAIPQKTKVTLRRRDDGLVKLATDAEFGGTQPTYRLGEEARQGTWSDYVAGVTWLLRREGHEISGFDALVSSSVPIGAGLSSSAALLVATLRTLRQAFDLALDDVAVAKLAQRVENEFVGARVGIMDQMAASLADEGTALFLDTRTLAYRKVPLAALPAETFIVDSGVKHSHAHGGYNTRRAECEAACKALGVEQLRDLGLESLGRVMRLPEPLGRRARHVITENARVLDAVDALVAGDVVRLGALFLASHASMRDDYEVSVPEVDRLVETAMRQPGVVGARLTGGGFGGSIVGLCARGTRDAVVRGIKAEIG